MKRELNSLKKNTIKHNITLEIWTNGSIHPRDALYEGFKNLIKLFSKLKKVNPFFNDTNLLKNNFFPLPPSSSRPVPPSGGKKVEVGGREATSLEGVASHKGLLHVLSLAPMGQGKQQQRGKSGTTLAPLEKEDRTEPNELTEKNNYLLKQIKTTQIPSFFYQDLIPLNETSFLETYMAPNLRNFYINNNIKTNVLKNPILSNKPRSIELNTNTKFNEFLKNKEKGIFLKKMMHFDISLLNLSLRTYTYLKRLKITTIGELIKLSDEDLKNLDKKVVEQIKKLLNKINLNS